MDVRDCLDRLPLEGKAMIFAALGTTVAGGYRWSRKGVRSALPFALSALAWVCTAIASKNKVSKPVIYLAASVHIALATYVFRATKGASAQSSNGDLVKRGTDKRVASTSSKPSTEIGGSSAGSKHVSPPLAQPPASFPASASQVKEDGPSTPLASALDTPSSPLAASSSLPPPASSPASAFQVKEDEPAVPLANTSSTPSSQLPGNASNEVPPSAEVDASLPVPKSAFPSSSGSFFPESESARLDSTVVRGRVRPLRRTPTSFRKLAERTRASQAALLATPQNTEKGTSASQPTHDASRQNADPGTSSRKPSASAVKTPQQLMAEAMQQNLKKKAVVQTKRGATDSN